MARRYREYSLTQRKNGLWQASFIREGKRKYVYGRDRDEVIAAVTRAKLAPPSPAPSTSVSVLLTGWIKAVTPTLGPQTLVSYANIVDRHLIPGFAGVSVAELTDTDIETYIDKKLAEGFSPRTVQYHHRLLSLALARAEKRGMVATNVARLVKPPTPKPPEIKPLTKEEIKTLLDGTSGQERNFYAVAIFTGLRLGELVGLPWSSFDTEQGTLTVTRAVARVRGRSAFVPPKSATSRRTLPLPAQAYQALQDQRRRATSTDLVFADPSGHLLVGATVTGQFTDTLKRLGIAHRRFHDLRHTCASQMLAAGGHLDDVKRYLGHSSIKLTSDTYGHLDPGRQRQVADFLSDSIDVKIDVHD